MPEQQFKRNVAYKLRIGDILIGKPINNGDKFAFVELGNRQIVRVNIVGNIIDRYENPGSGGEQPKRYLFLTLDDGSGQIKLKTFGDDYIKFKEITQGQTVAVIGVLRHWNNETYVSPEIIKIQDPKYLLLRKLETEKEKRDMPNQNLASNLRTISKPEAGNKEQNMAIRDNLLGLIRKSEDNGGIEMPEVFKSFREVSEPIINQEIKKLLEEGIIFEPRPGKVRYLG